MSFTRPQIIKIQTSIFQLIRPITTTIIIFQLFTLSIPVLGGDDCDYSDDADLLASKTSCTAASMEWICELNRCMTTEQAASFRQKSETCTAMTDENEKKKCYLDIVIDETGGLEVSDKGPSSIAQGVYGMTVALVVLSFVSKKNTAKCTSKTILATAGGVFLLAEIYQYFFLGKKLEELRDAYAKKTADQNSYNAQLEAFQYLQDEQNEVKKIAGQKNKIYLALTALYGAASVMAVYEMVTGKSCTGGTTNQSYNENFFRKYTSTNKDNEDSITNALTDQILSVLVQKAFAEDHAEIYKKKDLSSYVPLLLGAATGAAASLYPPLGKYVSSSPGIAVISAVAAVMSIQLASAAKKAESQAKENIEKLNKALAMFKSDAGGFCPEGRTDLSNPSCYCYTDDGEQNTDHSNSETCKALWQNGVNLNQAATNYTNNNTLSSVGCVTIDDQFDQNCDCKSLVNKATGENACMKTVVATGDIGSIGTASSLSSIIDEANKITGGSLASGTLTEGNAQNLARKNNKMIKEMLRKFNADNKSSFNVPNPEQSKAIMNNLLTPEILKAAANSPLVKGNINNGEFVKKNPEAIKAIKNAMKKSGINASYNDSGNNKKDIKRNNSAFDFDFGTGQSNQANARDLQFDKIDDKLNFNKQDINADAGPSIWKIISKRFNQTALRRLFEQE